MLRLVVLITTLFLQIFAAPYLLLQPQRVISTSYLFPTLLAVNRQRILTLLPSSDIGTYYVVNTDPLDETAITKSAVPSSNSKSKPNNTMTAHSRLPTLGDAIGLIPFLPIEINVPDMFSSMFGFFSWLVNWRPQAQTTPRIYFLPKNYPRYGNPSDMTPQDSGMPHFGDYPSYGVLTRRSVLPTYEVTIV